MIALAQIAALAVAALETVDGRWVDSRVLARKGLAMLARGEFASTASIASR